MLRLGMRTEVQQVLEWTLDHQTLPGTYAWVEAINARHGGLELGDMPHSWAAADLRIDVDGGPPSGWRVRLPGLPKGVLVDDFAAAIDSANEVRFAPGTHRLLVS